jgi:2-oxoglutarate ferredoxin oxidoreductase subunit gamma
METSIIISGFGGQGTLFAGQVLAYAALDTGKQVTWIPSYGPEMRGGTANCTVVISDEEIGSPIVRHPTIVLALNLPSLDKYEYMIQPGGLMIANASLINREVERAEIDAIHIPANEIAEELGNMRLANMVAMGAMVTARPFIPLTAVKQALEDHLPERHKKLLPANFKALQHGADFARNVLTTAAA